MIQITKETPAPGIIMFLLKGSLDITTAPELAQTFRDCFNQGVYNFIIDLSQLDYLSRTGAGALVGILPRVEENNGDIVLLQPPPAVEEALTRLGLSQCFMITHNWATALQALTSSEDMKYQDS